MVAGDILYGEASDIVCKWTILGVCKPWGAFVAENSTRRPSVTSQGPSYGCGLYPLAHLPLCMSHWGEKNTPKPLDVLSERFGVELGIPMKLPSQVCQKMRTN